MKVTIDIDCTPAEARAFLGLPEVEGVQSRVMAEVERQMLANLKAMNAEALFNTWLPASMKSFEQLQKMFWGQLSGGMTGEPKPAAKPKGAKGKDKA